MNGIGRKLVWLLLPLVGACDADNASSITSDGASSDTPSGGQPSVQAETSGRTAELSSADSQPAEGTGAENRSSEPDAEQTASTAGMGSGFEATAPTSSGSSEAPDGPTVVGERVFGARCDREQRLGAFGVRLDTDRTSVGGVVSNGVLPSSIPEVAAEAGGCQLLVPRNLLCTACEPTQACAGDDVCVSKPSRVSAGTLSVEGLLVEVAVEPNGITTEYSKTILDPFPAYVPGDLVHVRAQGEVVGAFEAELIGVSPLTSSLAAVTVKQGQSAILAWDAEATGQAETAVFVNFSVNVHGAVTGWIECTAPDTGEFEIPAELVSELIDLGSSGFPRVDLERRSSATVDLDSGCVELYVSSEITLDIDLEGLSSCNDDEDCASDQTCNEQKVCE